MFTRFFINRPIFASVMSIMITLAGGIALFSLPIAQYPEITPPTVEVSAIYPGANAKVVVDTVAAPIEQQVNGVEGMLYMSSQCTNDGSYSLTITFQHGVDLNIAQVLVQNRVALAQPILPDLANPEEFGEMILKTNPGGGIVRLRDVAKLELGAQGYDQTCTMDGKPTVALSVYQLPGSNALQVAKSVRAKVKELKERFPAGVD